jgi:hypothetical protein
MPLHSMFEDMLYQVGLTTQNYSVRQSILMLVKLYDPFFKIPLDDVKRLSSEWYSDTSLQTVRHYDYIGISHDEYIDFMDGTYSDGGLAFDSGDS